MKYELIERENSVVSVNFSQAAEINAELYSTINRNTALVLPCMRDLSVPNTINYDALGSVVLSEELKSTVFDKQALYSFVMGILDVLEKISSLGIDEKQIVLECEYMYISLYDKSVRFICLPVDKDMLEAKSSAADMLKKIALTVKSDGAYELLGYMIEKTAADVFSVSEFKNGLVSVFSAGASNKPMQKAAAQISSDIQNTNVPNVQSAVIFNSAPLEPAPDKQVYSGREYVPEGVPFAYSGNVSDNASDTIDPDRKTQVLFAASQDMGDMPYLSPVDNNTQEARIYIAGEKLTIGRSSENDLQINIATVSGKHAEIHRSGSKCTIIDLNSTNKTYVNGAPIKPNSPVKLKHQDLVAFNKARYRFFER